VLFCEILYGEILTRQLRSSYVLIPEPDTRCRFSCQFFACSQAGIGIPVQRRAWLMFVIVGGGPTFFGDNVQAGIQQ